MSEEFPTNNPENQESNLSGAEMLTDMPSFEEMRRQNAVPEGVRDEQDYQEYLEEKQALANESFAIQKELID